jgi:hypothetical protein
MTQQLKDLQTLLISKAMADEGFKSEVISNPKAVIAREIGQELPEGVEIEVLEPTSKTAIEKSANLGSLANPWSLATQWFRYCLH